MPVPVAAELLIPVTAARLHANVVPVVTLVAVYVNGFPVVTAPARLLDNTGNTLGAATALAAGLVQVLTVLVTVYVPAVVTVIELVVAPVLHSNEPVPVAVKTELPQLLVTETVGAEGTELTVRRAELEFTAPTELVHRARYRLLLSAVAVAKVKVADVAPVILL